MDKHGIIAGFWVLVLVACFLQSNAQTVGTACPNNDECTATLEACNTNGGLNVCECAANYINIGNGTCVAKACSTDAQCINEKGIANSYCNTTVCACNDLSAADSTNTTSRGTCVKTACTAEGDECDSTKNLICDTGTSMCACNVTYKLSGQSCEANAINDTCTSNDNCAAITNGICDVTASSKTCKTAIGKTCVVGSCVMNADCVDATCTCMSGYSGTEGGNTCTANSADNAGFTFKMNVIGMILAMVTSVIYVM